jgi:hypothetical protein
MKEKKNYNFFWVMVLYLARQDLSWLAMKPKQKFDQIIRLSTKFQPFRRNETFHTI